MSWKDKQSESMDIGGNKIPGERTAVQRPWGREEPAVAQYSRGWAQRAGAWGRDVGPRAGCGRFFGVRWRTKP